MALRELRAFYVAAQLGSITKAADALDTTQPTISRQISSLERELGAALIVHGHRPLRLTEAGEALVKLAEPFFQGAQVLEGVRHSVDYEAQITIVATPTIASHNLADAIATFTANHLRWSIQMIAKNPVEGLSLIQSGYADLGLLPDPGIPFQFEFIQLFETPLVLIAPLHHILGDSSSPPQIEELVKYPLVLLRQGSASRAAFDTALRRTDLKCGPLVEVEGVEAVKRLIKQTQGVSVVPTRGLTAEDYESFTIVPMPHVFPPLRGGIVTLRDRTLTRPVSEFMEALKRSTWMSRR